MKKALQQPLAPFSPGRPSRREIVVCGGRPASLALADWLEDLAVFGRPLRNPLDSEIAHQLSLAIENWYLVSSALRKSETEPAASVLKPKLGREVRRRL